MQPPARATADGGLYECTATNDVGQLRHAAWLNVSGPAYVRPMPNVSTIAGGSLAIMCPVGGWPIEQISWFKNGTRLPTNHRQKVFPNGTLLISELNELLDAGLYTCQAKSAAPGPGTGTAAGLFSSSAATAGEVLASNQVHVIIKSKCARARALPLCNLKLQTPHLANQLHTQTRTHKQP